MSLISRLRDFAKSLAVALQRLREQLQREIDEERNPPFGRA
jgi:hypothetical protein